MRRSLGLLLLLVTTVGTGWAAEIEPARLVAEKTAAEWNAAFERGQLDAIVSLYEDNAMLLQPNGVVAHGGSEISYWELAREVDLAREANGQARPKAPAKPKRKNA